MHDENTCRVVPGCCPAGRCALPAAQQPPKPCSRPEQNQFDFWVGEWKLTWPGEKGELQHGTNSIRRVLDGEKP